MVDENHNISTIYMCGRRKWQQLCAVRIEQVPRYLGTCGIAAKFRYPGTCPESQLQGCANNKQSRWAWTWHATSSFALTSIPVDMKGTAVFLSQVL